MGVGVIHCCVGVIRIRDFFCRSSWDVFRENDQVFLMFSSRRIERNVTSSDMSVLCDS